MFRFYCEKNCNLFRLYLFFGELSDYYSNCIISSKNQLIYTPIAYINTKI